MAPKFCIDEASKSNFFEYLDKQNTHNSWLKILIMPFSLIINEQSLLIVGYKLGHPIG